MKTEKILSIVIPTYNIEKYIEKCLSSFIDRKLLPKIEVIVVNDGSKDNSSNLAKNFVKRYPNSFIVIDKENGGHGSTINKGLEVAQGKFFMIVDGDDWIDSKALNKVITILENNNDLDAVFYNFVKEIQSNNTQRFRNLNKLFKDKNIDLENVKFDIDRQVGLPNTIYKTENLRKIDLKLAEKTFYVDVEYMTYPLLTINKAMYVNEYVYHYLIGRPTQSVNIKTALSHIEDRKKVIINIFNYFNKLDKKKVSKFALNSYKYKIASVIESYYDILILGDKNFAKIIKEFDKYVEKSDNEVYQIMSKKYLHIFLARKLNYSKIIIKCSHFIDKNLKRVKRLIKGDL